MSRLATANKIKQNERSKMWVMCVLGAFSLVQKVPGEYQVRGRVKQDLKNLCGAIGLPISRIIVTENSDYAFRVVLDKPELDRLMAVLADGVVYPNFKNEISRRPDQRNKSASYHRIWSTMADLQPWPPYRSPRAVATDARHNELRNAANDVEPPAPAVVRKKGASNRNQNEI